MGTATRKAAKAMAKRTALTSLVIAGGIEAQGARLQHKALNGTWDKRFNSSPGGFHAPNGRAVMHCKASRPYRAN
jgi:hypothetical protein